MYLRFVGVTRRRHLCGRGELASVFRHARIERFLFAVISSLFCFVSLLNDASRIYVDGVNLKAQSDAP